MRVHVIKIKESDWINSIYRTIEWEKRVNIVKWVHDYENKMYFITIKIK